MATVRRLIRSFGLPLLLKELQEQSSRRRTWIVRSLYASLLFGTAGWAFLDDFVRRFRRPLDWLGRGDDVLEVVVVVQFLGIFLFLPAMTAGALTQEKERNSLGLLFLTSLGPSTLLIEKLASRLVSMASFLLLSLPLLMVAYALGGVSQHHVYSAVWLLGVTTLQVSCISLMCSAWFRTTVGAFIASYMVGFVVLLAGPFYYAIHIEILKFRQPDPFLQVLHELGLLSEGSEACLGLTFLVYTFVEEAENNPFWKIVMHSLPALSTAMACLVLARVFIVRRAFIPSRNVLLSIFRWLDRRLMAWNDRFAAGVILSADRESLPEDDPVAWRETSRKSLGTVRYLVRVLLVLQLPALVVCFMVFMSGTAGSTEPLSAVLVVLWPLVLVMISATSTSLFGSERTGQTLDVLLTTPISATELVKQKFRGVRRLMLVLSVPLLTVVFFESVYRFEFAGPAGPYLYPYRFAPSPAAYAIGSLLSIVIYLPLIAWFSLWVGMWCRSQGRAIITALAGLVGWCSLPALLVAPLVDHYDYYHHTGLSLLFLFSPAAFIPMNEFNEMPFAWTMLVLNFLVYGGFLFLFRWLCLAHAPRWLGRMEIT